MLIKIISYIFWGLVAYFGFYQPMYKLYHAMMDQTESVKAIQEQLKEIIKNQNALMNPVQANNVEDATVVNFHEVNL